MATMLPHCNGHEALQMLVGYERKNNVYCFHLYIIYQLSSHYICWQVLAYILPFM